MPQSVLEMAKDLITAQITAGQMSPDTMQEALQRTYTSLMALKTQEETGTISPVQGAEAARAPVDWRKSISRLTITCLECGATYNQLSKRHLQDHELDGRSYRVKFGIPRTQPLAARAVTATRRKITQQVRPWEKAPRFMKAQEAKAQAAKKAGRKKMAAKTTSHSSRIKKWA